MRNANGAKAGKAIGRQIIEGLTEFADALASGVDVRSTFTSHQVRFALPTRTYSAAAVKRTRLKIHCSQAVFAEVMGVSANAVRAWEQGVNPPSLTACRLMDEINRQPSFWIARLTGARVPRVTRAPARRGRKATVQNGRSKKANER